MIILKESIPRISLETINRWDTMEDNEKEKIIDKLIDRYNKPGLENIREAIKICCYQHGLNPQTNKFIQLFDKFNFPLTTEHNQYIKQLNQLFMTDNIDLTKDYLSLESLYNEDRDLEDFTYTVRLFDIVNTPYKLKQFFKNTDEIDESDLFLPNSKIIKPVGGEGDGLETLYGTVESWSGQSGENDQIDKSPELNSKQLKKIKKNYHFDNLETIPKKLWKENQIIYLNSLGKHSDPDEYVEKTLNDFAIFKDGKWIPYKY